MKLIFLFAVTLLLTPIAGISGAICSNLYLSISADGTKLYFSSNRHGSNYEIYRSDLDGQSNLERLTFTSVNNFYASENSAGTKIIWQNGDYGSASCEIYMMDTDGTNQINLTNNSNYDGFPNFSPDGQKIVFEGWDLDAYPEIFTMDADGTDRQQITSVAGADWQSAPLYDPTGNYIYFSKGYNADNHYVRMDLDGNNWVDITPPNTFGIAEGGLRFSPDGTKIIFLTTEYLGYNNGSDIVIADLDGSNWDNISNSVAPNYYYFPVWHPTNNKIYFSFNYDGYSEWYTYSMSTIGDDMTELSNCSLVGNDEFVMEENMYVYPNPAKDILNVDYTVGDHIVIIDCVGRMVLKTNSKTLSIEDLDPGYYKVLLKDQLETVLEVKSLLIN